MLCIAWTIKWRSSVKPPKSGLLTLACSTPQQGTTVCGMFFAELSHLVHLGVGVDSSGVFTVGHVRSRIDKCVRRLQELTDSGLHLGGLNPEACVELFEQSVLFIVSYAFSLCPPGSRRIKSLDRAQIDFGNEYLGLPPGSPGSICKSELGLLDFELRALKGRLLLLHRVHNSEVDTLTNAMLGWPIDDQGGTFLDHCQASLGPILRRSSLRALLSTPYFIASSTISAALLREQQVRWQTQSSLSDQTQAHAADKGQWGRDPYLLGQQPDQVRRFIQFRAGTFPLPSVTHPGSGRELCALCRRQTACREHLLWQCPSTAGPRAAFFRLAGPHLSALLLPLNPTAATRAVLGGGGTTCQSLWKDLSNPSISFVSDIALIVERS